MNPTNYKLMLFSSLRIPEDNSRLYYNLFQKKTNCNVFFFGGSITVGFEGTGYVCPYPDLIQKHLHDLGIDSNIYNYSSCSFHSKLGIALLQQALLLHVPDLLILEYAVNNGFDKDYIDSFEGMILKTLHANPLASIIILCTCDENGYGCDNYMIEIADHYHLPVILMKKALAFGATFGFSWSEYSKDHCHPNGFGQQLIADCFLELFLQTKMKVTETISTSIPFFLPSDACFCDKYQAAILQPCCKEQIEKGFHPINSALPFSSIVYHISNTSQPIECTIHCETLYLLYEQSYDIKTAGQLAVWLDTNPDPILLDGYSILGWNCASIVRLFSDSPGIHHIRLQLEASTQKKSFKIYGFLTF